MYLHISSSLSLLNHPWISQNENCILVNSSLPLIRAFWDPLISPFWSPQHKYGFPSKHLTSLVTEYLLVLWGVSLPQGGGGGGTGGGVYHRRVSIYHYNILTGGSLYHGGQNTISHRQWVQNVELWTFPGLYTVNYDANFVATGGAGLRFTLWLTWSLSFQWHINHRTTRT